MSRGYVLFTSTQPTARMCEAGTLCKQVFNFQKALTEKNRKSSPASPPLIGYQLGAISQLPGRGRVVRLRNPYFFKGFAPKPRGLEPTTFGYRKEANFDPGFRGPPLVTTEPPVGVGGGPRWKPVGRDLYI